MAVALRLAQTGLVRFGDGPGALAALLREKERNRGQGTAFVLTGANVDTARLADILRRRAADVST